MLRVAATPTSYVVLVRSIRQTTHMNHMAWSWRECRRRWTVVHSRTTIMHRRWRSVRTLIEMRRRSIVSHHRTISASITVGGRTGKWWCPRRRREPVVRPVSGVVPLVVGSHLWSPAIPASVWTPSIIPIHFRQTVDDGNHKTNVRSVVGVCPAVKRVPLSLTLRVSPQQFATSQLPL